MKGTPSKRDLLEAIDDVVKQRNELQLLLSACVARAGGEVVLSCSALQGLRGLQRDVTLYPDNDGYILKLETSKHPDFEHEEVQ